MNAKGNTVIAQLRSVSLLEEGQSKQAVTAITNTAVTSDRITVLISAVPLAE